MPIILVVLVMLAFWVAFWFIRTGGIEHFRRRRRGGPRRGARLR
jgi:hypothetical protein